MRCDFRTHHECSCGPDECRASPPHLIHRQARYEEATAKATRAFHVAATCLAFCVVLAGVLLAAEGGIKRQDMILQEEIAWQP